jgi:predicted DNA-binding protein with PD1-like motif/glutaredoxin
MQPLPLELPAGADLRRSLERTAAEQEAAGFVVSAVGNLSQAALRFPGRPQPTLLSGELEIISLTGSIAPERVHLHLSVSDGDGRVIGGHLEPGSRVHTGAEILVTLLGAPRAAGGPTRGVSTASVEIAVLPGCPFSARALRMLRTLGIPHTVQTVVDEDERRSLRQRSGSGSLPQIFIDGESIGGYDALAELHGSGGLERLRPI